MYHDLCTFCKFSQTATKERPKSYSLSEQNIGCKIYLYCKSLCVHLVQSVHDDGKEARCKMFAASLANIGFKIMGDENLQERLQPTLQDETPSNKITSNRKQICQSPQEQLSRGGIAFPDRKASSRKRFVLVFPGLLQQVVPGSTTKQVEAHLGSKLPEYLGMETFNMETPESIRLPRMGHVPGCQQCILSHPSKSKVKEMSKVSSKCQTYEFRPLPFGLATSPLEFTRVLK